MACYKDRKITVRFTQETYLQMMDEIEEMGSWECKSPSDFIRRLVRLELGRLQTERRLKDIPSDNPPAKRPTPAIGVKTARRKSA